MSILHSVLALIVTLGVLITFHEFGHFWVARRCGVKVLRFSIGFGKPLIRWHDRHQTEFVIAALPLGGYVKMLDEREGEVPAELLDQAFNRKPVGQRFAIVAAGPLANFLLAILAYWLLFVIGTQVVAPIVGEVSPQTPAAQAGLQPGDEIVRIGGKETPSWQAVNMALLGYMGDTTDITLEVRPQDASHLRQLQLPVNRFLSGQETPDPMNALGLQPWRPDIPPLIGSVQSGSAADRAGLQVGDRIDSINQQPVTRWQEVVPLFQASPGLPLQLTLVRDGQRLNFTLTPDARSNAAGELQGFVGVGVAQPAWPEHLLRQEQFGPLAAFGQSISKTADMSWLTLKSIGRMITGLISPTNLSGPITIARIASDSAKSGWETFISFLAYVSISLGILNLLPIPILDGGHLVFYTLEALRGKPVSERNQERAARVGLMLLGSLMLMAFYFDLMRL